MITRTKINEWIHQVEVTPVLAPILIRQITDRFLELDEENEELRAENLALSTGNKVHQLEKKIAELEFQLELLKRQATSSDISSDIEATRLLVYNDRGQLLHLEIDEKKLASTQPFARIGGLPDIQSHNFGLLTAAPYDQLLMVFSTGRTAILPIEQIAVNPQDSLDWSAAYQVDLHGIEELIWIMPITRLHLYDLCIQVSRFGYARKIDIQYFKTFLSNNNIGKGVKFNFDRILNLVLGKKNELLVLVTKMGSCTSIVTDALPVSLDEVIHLKVNDYVVSSLTLPPEDILVAVTTDGVFLAQRQSWLLPAKNGEHRQRQLLSSSKENLVLAGAIPLHQGDRLVACYNNGSLVGFEMENISPRNTSQDKSNSGHILAITSLPASLRETTER